MVERLTLKPKVDISESFLPEVQEDARIRWAYVEALALMKRIVFPQPQQSVGEVVPGEGSIFQFVCYDLSGTDAERSDIVNHVYGSAEIKYFASVHDIVDAYRGSKNRKKTALQSVLSDV